ncbi:MAG: hypothetical protein AB7T20_12835 [Steroidobacteraceae bacterium]
MTRNLLVLTAVLEAATGFGLLAMPVMVVSLLLGASLDAPGALVIARVTGAAMLSLGLACWLVRDDGRTRPGRAIVTAMLVYNVIVAAVLAYAGVMLDLTGIGLGPAAGAHTVLAVWCAASLRTA